MPGHLSNRAIWEALDAGHIRITPEPARTIEGARPGYDSDAVNLTLDKVFLRPNKPHRGRIAFDPDRWDVKQFLAQNAQKIELPDDGSIMLAPGELLLAQTQEVISFPPAKNEGDPSYTGYVFGRSTCARCGFTAASFDAPCIHHGNDQKITLELVNAGSWTIVLRPGMLICQLVIEQLVGRPECRLSQFHQQGSPCGGKENTCS
jgi:deoxycytidine triphosphate deaminase